MSFFPDWLTGLDRNNVDAGNKADTLNRQLTEDMKSKGLISEQDYNTAIKHYDASASEDVDEEINQASLEGLNQGAENIRNSIGATINLGIGTPLKLIPWQVWLAAGLYVAWRLGVFNGILGKVRR